MNNFVTNVINFLERLDGENQESKESDKNVEVETGSLCYAPENNSLVTTSDVGGSSYVVEVNEDGENSANEGGEPANPGFWLINDLFGGIF